MEGEHTLTKEQLARRSQIIQDHIQKEIENRLDLINYQVTFNFAKYGNQINHLQKLNRVAMFISVEMKAKSKQEKA
jgi:hypothetical protein